MPAPSAPSRSLRVIGARVHNLRGIDVDVPLGRLTVVTGTSGSGKSSLAFDTIYAEARRRFLETVAPRRRRRLPPVAPPDADILADLPPAIAVRQQALPPSARSTVATAAGLHDLLRLLFAKVGRVRCPSCGAPLAPASPESIADELGRVPTGNRFFVAAPVPTALRGDAARLAKRLQSAGWTRVVLGARTIDLQREGVESLTEPAQDPTGPWIVVDRLRTGETDAARLLDSLEAAFAAGEGRCVVAIESPASETNATEPTTTIDGRAWTVRHRSLRCACAACGIEYPELEPAHFGFRGGRGTCPECRGHGTVVDFAWEHVVPDASRSLAEGAVVPWTDPLLKSARAEMEEAAAERRFSTTKPFARLSEADRAWLAEGDSETGFVGLRRQFRSLASRPATPRLQRFLERWTERATCPACGGDRLRREFLSVSVGGRSIAAWTRDTVADAERALSEWERGIGEPDGTVTRFLRSDLRQRLAWLERVGLGYLCLDRPLATLSVGERQRIALTSALASELVDMLFVLDEPSAGLHPSERVALLDSVRQLQSRGNTVLVVEHASEFVHAADHVIELGPGAGAEGGRVVYAGPPQGLRDAVDSPTGRWLARGAAERATLGERATRPANGALVLRGVRTHGLKNIDAGFPLGRLTVVTGPGGGGKSSLVFDTLHPAWRAAREPGFRPPPTLQCDALAGADGIDEVIVAEGSSATGSVRALPAAVGGMFGEIRKLFAATPEARARGWTAGTFGLHAADGGRCPQCRGTGLVSVDLHVLSEATIDCPECGGLRYRRDVLQATWRGLSIAEVLRLTVREAFPFFRNHRRCQRVLKTLIDVGLEYLPLGQPGPSLSGGERQRLHLAERLLSKSKSRGLFLLDEPTVGLHPADVSRLVLVLTGLLDAGHTVVVVGHDRQVLAIADHVIDLGPGSGAEGGQIVYAGPPEGLRERRESATGRWLASDDEDRAGNT